MLRQRSASTSRRPLAARLVEAVVSQHPPAVGAQPSRANARHLNPGQPRIKQGAFMPLHAGEHQRERTSLAVTQEMQLARHPTTAAEALGRSPGGVPCYRPPDSADV
jgi:hypothetical protein